MAKILNGFQTTAGNQYVKKQDSAGRTYYVKEGEGRVSAKSYAAANKHFKYAIRVEGDLPPEIRDAGSLERLERITNVPFTTDFVQAIRGKADTPRERRRAEGNRWIGFRESMRDFRPDLSDEEIAKEYLRFRRELDEAETAEARAIIKQRYNLGGS